MFLNLEEETFHNFLKFVTDTNNVLLSIKINYLMTCQLFDNGSWNATHNDLEDIEHMYFLPYVNHFFSDKNAYIRLVSVLKNYSLDITGTKIYHDLNMLAQ